MDVVQPLLPDGLTVQTFDGQAWVSMLPFLMDDVRAFRLPALPWLSRFPETNLRTYVTGPDGAEGIYFLSVEVSRLPAVLSARLGLALPYRWADMTVRADPDSFAFYGRRRALGAQAAARYAVRVQLGEHYQDSELTPLDLFLTARFRLYTAVLGKTVAVNVRHRPWPLRRATIVELRQTLTGAIGLPSPTSPPLVHASDEVQAWIGVPGMVRSAG